MSSVYWIHLPNHSDITSEGYIGVTSAGVEKRFSQHLKGARSGSTTILSKALTKYGSEVVITTLLEADDDYCYMIEHNLRCADRTGWNTVAGGGKPPVFRKGHTATSKTRIGEGSKRTANSPAKLAAYAAKVGMKHSEDAKRKMRTRASGRLPWENSTANTCVWRKAGDVFDALKANPTFGFIKLERLFGLPKESLKNMYNKFTKQNWNPKEDARWLSWVQNTTQFKGNTE